MVSTPIGNLDDITLRAIETLRAADLILAEDTRSSRVLLQHLGVSRPVRSAHEHNEARVIPVLLRRLGAGANVALICDAGTPLVSDPGRRLVAAVLDAGFRVSPVPGPSAVTAALAVAGLETTPFTFFGFLPRQGVERQETLTALSALSHTGVVYEAPGRVAGTLADLVAAGQGERRCVVGREITKKFEEFRRGTVAELAAYYSEHVPRGEIVIMISGASQRQVDDLTVMGRIRALRQNGMSARDAAALVADELGVPRNRAYRLAVTR